MKRYTEEEMRELAKMLDDSVLGEALQQLLDERRWIPVEERLPSEDGCYLAYISETPFFQRNVVFYNAYDNVWHSGDETVAYWLPLPPPPEGKP